MPLLVTTTIIFGNTNFLSEWWCYTDDTRLFRSVFCPGKQSWRILRVLEEKCMASIFYWKHIWEAVGLLALDHWPGPIYSRQASVCLLFSSFPAPGLLRISQAKSRPQQKRARVYLTKCNAGHRIELVCHQPTVCIYGGGFVYLWYCHVKLCNVYMSICRLNLIYISGLIRPHKSFPLECSNSEYSSW